MLSATRDHPATDGGARAPAGASLGTNTKFVRRSQGKNPFRTRIYRFTARVERYELMAVAASLLPKERVGMCLRWPVPAGAHLVYSPARESAHLAGLMVCGSVWSCSTCATRISERRRGEVAQAVAYAERQGAMVVLATYTLSHGPTDALEASLGALNAGYSGMRRRRDYNALRASYGLSHSIKAIEVTWGEASGFHPHLHVLHVVNAGTDAAALRRDLAAAWLPSVRHHGFSASTAHGVDVRATWGEVGKYVSKMGRTWGAPEELTKANSKTGRGDRYSPADLLRSYRDTGNQVHAQRFREYALTMKGSHQLRWSPGFKRLAGVADRTDADLAANWLDDDNWTYTLARFSASDWAAVRWCGPEACAELERAGDLRDVAGVAALVDQCRARYFAEGWGL